MCNGYGANAGEMGFISVNFGYTELFCIPEVTSVFFSSVTVFLGTLCCSIKQIEAAYMLAREHGLALHEMQGDWVSSHGEGEVSWVFSNSGRNMGYIFKLRWGWPFETRL